MEADTASHRPFRVSGSARKYMNRNFGVGQERNCLGSVTNAHVERGVDDSKRPFRDLPTADTSIGRPGSPMETMFLTRGARAVPDVYCSPNPGTD